MDLIAQLNAAASRPAKKKRAAKKRTAKRRTKRTAKRRTKRTAKRRTKRTAKRRTKRTVKRRTKRTAKRRSKRKRISSGGRTLSRRPKTEAEARKQIGNPGPKNEALWKRAKAIVKPHWDDNAEPWAVVQKVYRNLGGR